MSADATRYPVPAATHRAELVASRSRFLATVGRAATRADAEAFVRAVSAELPDATHHCFAFVAGPPGTTGQVGMSDDGEPRGTAGRPMLTVLLHAGVGEVVTVVSRWYGGTNLGTGGLVRAYGGAVQLALATLPVEERVTRVALDVAVEYAAVAVVQQLLVAYEAVVASQAFGADARWTVRVPVERVAAFRQAVADATRGRGEVVENRTPERRED